MTSRRALVPLLAALVLLGVVPAAHVVAVVPTPSDRSVSVEPDGSVTITLIASGSSATATNTGVHFVETFPAHGNLGSISQTTCATGFAGCWATITYTPDLAYVGPDSFTYRMQSNPTVATVTIDVAPATAAPSTVADATHVAIEDVSTYGPQDLIVNDTDPDGDSLAAELVTQAAHGTATVYPNGWVRYVGDPGYSAFANGGVPVTDSFTYRASDGTHVSAPRTVNVFIFEVNDPPSFTSGGNVTVAEDGGAQTVTGWASDIRSGTIYEEPFETVSFTVTADSPSLFTVQPAIASEADPGPGATSNLTFTPKANAFGTTTITVTAKDDGGTGAGDGDDTADPITFTLTLTGAQDAPVANDDTANTPEDTLVDIAVTANDTDVDGDTLTVTDVTAGTKGTTTIRPGGAAVRYTPASDATGADSFGYTISDGHGNTASATVNVTIGGANDAPTCPADALGATEDTPAPSTVTCTDADAGDTLTYSVVAQGTKGTVAMNDDGSYTYTPAADINGADSFTYHALDGASAASNTATVSVTIAAVDDPPTFTVGPDVAVAEDAGAQTRIGWATDISVGGPDETLLQTPAFSIAANTNTGLFSAQPAVSAAGTLTFTARTNATGSAGVTVRLSDGVAQVDHLFTITVANVADPPNAVNDTGVTVPALGGARAIDVLANDLNADPGETLSVVSVTQGAKGKVAITGGGTGVSYSPTGCNVGTDTFTYTLSDGNGGTDNATVLLSITRSTVKPTAAVPTYAFIVGGQLGSTSVPVRVGYCATDPGSGIARYQLQQSTDGRTYASVALASAKSTSSARSLTVGHRYRFRVRAIDGDGSIGGYATGANSLVRRSQESSFQMGAGWAAVRSSTASAGWVRYTYAANASATFGFSGRVVGIVSPTSPTRGSFKVFVDGVLVGTVSEKTSTTIARRVVFSRTLSAGAHTLQIVAVGNGRIDIDAVITLD